MARLLVWLVVTARTKKDENKPMRTALVARKPVKNSMPGTVNEVLSLCRVNITRLLCRTQYAETHILDCSSDAVCEPTGCGKVSKHTLLVPPTASKQGTHLTDKGELRELHQNIVYVNTTPIHDASIIHTKKACMVRLVGWEVRVIAKA